MYILVREKIYKLFDAYAVLRCRDVSDSAFTYSLLLGEKEKKQLRLFRHSSVQWYHLNKPIICFIFLKSLPWLYLAGFSLKNTRTHSTAYPRWNQDDTYCLPARTTMVAVLPQRSIRLHKKQQGYMVGYRVYPEPVFLPLAGISTTTFKTRKKIYHYHTL